MLTDRTLLLTVVGSRAHGTAHAESDVDLAGIAAPTRAQILGLFETFEQSDDADTLAGFVGVLTSDERTAASTHKLEGIVYSVHKALRLLCSANPNALELLYTRDAERRIVLPVAERLLAERDQFLTARCRDTFGGYAKNQLARIERHHRWHTKPPQGAPERADFGLPDETVLTRTQLSEDDTLVDVAKQERQWRHARDEWRQYRAWSRERDPARSALQADAGYDTRHGAHLVRLLRMGHEILSTGQVHVWRGDRDADELRAIRGGDWPYDALVDWARAALAELAELPTDLPEDIDRDAVDALCIALVESGLR